MKYPYLIFMALIMVTGCKSRNTSIPEKENSLKVKTEIEKDFVDSVFIISQNQERRHSVIIANSVGKIDSLLNHDDKFKYESEDIFTQKIILDDASIGYVFNYLAALKCIEYSDSIESQYTNYNIRWCSKKSGNKECLYFRPNDIINFFSSFQNHLNNSKHRKKFIEISNLCSEYIDLAKKERKLGVSR